MHGVYFLLLLLKFLHGKNVEPVLAASDLGLHCLRICPFKETLGTSGLKKLFMRFWMGLTD